MSVPSKSIRVLVLLRLYLGYSLGRRPIALDVLKLDLDVAWTPRPMLEVYWTLLG